MTAKELAEFLTAYAEKYGDREVVTPSADHSYTSVTLTYTERVEKLPKSSNHIYYSTYENNDHVEFVLVLE